MPLGPVRNRLDTVQLRAWSERDLGGDSLSAAQHGRPTTHYAWVRGYEHYAEDRLHLRLPTTADASPNHPGNILHDVSGVSGLTHSGNTLSDVSCVSGLTPSGDTLSDVSGGSPPISGLDCPCDGSVLGDGPRHIPLITLPSGIPSSAGCGTTVGCQRSGDVWC